MISSVLKIKKHSESQNGHITPRYNTGNYWIQKEGFFLMFLFSSTLRVKEMFHVLVHSPDACHSQGWGGLKRLELSSRSPAWGAEVQALSHPLSSPGYGGTLPPQRVRCRPGSAPTHIPVGCASCQGSKWPLQSPCSHMGELHSILDSCLGPALNGCCAHLGSELSEWISHSLSLWISN